jgi:hypothetical protein
MRQPALVVNRIATGKTLVYVLCQDKKFRYPYRRSRVVYIGTTKNGRDRIAGSAASHAEDILGGHGIARFQARIVTCREVHAVKLVVAQMRLSDPASYSQAEPVSYPGTHLKCHLRIGAPLEWAVEIKMARAFGDNGKLDDTWLKDLLSPYPEDHRALSDGQKLRSSAFSYRKAVIVYGFDYVKRTEPRPPSRATLAVTWVTRIAGEGPCSQRSLLPSFVGRFDPRGRPLLTASMGEFPRHRCSPGWSACSLMRQSPRRRCLPSNPATSA